MTTTNTKAIGVAYADPAFDSVQVGSSSAPIALTASGVLNGSYASTSASDGGDTRLYYSKLIWTGTASGEVYRGYAQITGTNGATAGTINGAHFTVGVDGGTVSGAANAIRATIGASVAAPGGTLAALQLDTDFASGTTVSSASAFIRVSDSGAGTGKLTRLMNIESGTGVFTAATSSSTLAGGIKVRIAGADYYLVVASAVA